MSTFLITCLYIFAACAALGLLRPPSSPPGRVSP